MPTRIELFDRFWLAYPRKDNKKDARKAFEKGCRDGESRAMIEGANRLAKYVKAEGVERQFIPLPATFIRKGGYENEWKCFDVDDRRLKEARRELREMEESPDLYERGIASKRAEIARLEAKNG